MSDQAEFPIAEPLIGPPAKRCRCCREVKLASEFGSDRSKKDGRRRDCKSCEAWLRAQRGDYHAERVRVQSRRRYDLNAEEFRRKAAEFRRSPYGKLRNALAVKRYQARNAAKRAAHIAVRAAIASGTLTRPTICEHADRGGCAGRIELHHEDYSKPLEVMCLCAAHHQRLRMKPRETSQPIFDMPQQKEDHHVG